MSGGQADRFFELSPELLAVASLRDGLWERVNPAFGRLLGWSEADLVGKPFMDIVHPGDIERSLAAVADLSEGDTLIDFEHRVLCKDGGFRWIAWTVSSDTAEGRLYASGRDTTETRKTQAALAESEARFRLMADANLIGVGFGDFAGNVTYVNDEILRMMGHSRADYEAGRINFKERIGDEANERLAAFEEALRREGAIAGYEREFVHPDGTHTPFIGAAALINDENGEHVSLALDITERREAQTALAEREEHLSRIFANATVGMAEIDRQGRMVRVNDEVCRILGRPREELLTLGVRDVTDPEFLAESFEGMERIFATGVTEGVDKRYVRPDGSTVWAHSSGTLLPGIGGREDLLLIVVSDLTARRRAEAALRASEERFRHFGEASPDVLWIRDADSMRLEYLTPSFEMIYGAPRRTGADGRIVSDWLDHIVAEDRPAVDRQLEHVRTGERATLEFRIRPVGSDQTRWIRDTSFPIREQDGSVTRIAGIGQDVTAEKELTGRLEIVVAELQHRTRNLLGVVRSLADRTLQGSTTLEGFQRRFRERLDTLARANGMLSRLDAGQRVAFDALLKAELAATGAVDRHGRGRQVTLDGPKGVRLRSSMVQTLALALHELTTNAVKHGALSSRDGHLNVDWDVVHENDCASLRVRWNESGVRLDNVEAAQANGSGYGRELIERALPYQFDARTEYRIVPEGVECTICLPLTAAPKECADA